VSNRASPQIPFNGSPSSPSSQQIGSTSGGKTLASSHQSSTAEQIQAQLSPPLHSQLEIASPPTTSTPSDRTPQKSQPQPRQRTKNRNGESILRVMVVEDDAINSQILQKRLRMDKHSVIVASNGQEAVDALRADRDIDAVLMDIQMPIMDGRTAAKEIRTLETTSSAPENVDPLRIDGRIPIFAVSASLYETDRNSLAEHFDGWLLKPLDFGRVRVLLSALEDPEKRSAEVHVQGHWERGGFLKDAPGKT